MSYNNTIDKSNSEYRANIDRVLKNKIAISGQDAVKKSFDKFFVSPAGLTELMTKDPTSYNLIYNQYKEAAIWKPYPATMRNNINGMLFKENIKLSEAPESLEYLEDNFDGAGTTLTNWAQEAVGEVLATDRYVSIVSWSSLDERAYVKSYPYESVIDWSTSVVGGVEITNYILIKVQDEAVRDAGSGVNVSEEIYRYKYLKFYLDDGNGNSYTINGKSPKEGQVSSIGGKIRLGNYHISELDSQYNELYSSEQKIGGKSVNYIPYVVLTKNGTSWRSKEPLVNGVVDLSTGIFNNSAQYEVALTQNATPVVYVTGETVNDGSLDNFKFGAYSKIEASGTGVKVGYLEPVGNGINEIRQAMDNKKSDVHDSGVYTVSDSKQGAETAEALRLQKIGDDGILSDLANTIEEAIKRLYKYASEFKTDINEEIDTSNMTVSMNRDFNARLTTVKDIFTMSDLVQNGAMSLYDYYKVLSKEGYTVLSWEEWKNQTDEYRNAFITRLDDPTNDQTIKRPVEERNQTQAAV